MNFSGQETLLAAEIVAIIAALVYCVAKKAAPFPVMFLLGVGYYWVFPLAAVVLFNSVEAKLIYRDFSDFGEHPGVLVAQWLFVLFAAMALVGHGLGVRAVGTATAKIGKSNFDMVISSDKKILPKTCLMVFVTLWCLFLATILPIREDLERGYQNSVADTYSVRGSLSAYAMAMMIVAVIGLINHSRDFFRWLFCTVTGWMLLLSWMALLGLGGRLYVASSLLIGVLLYTDSGSDIARWITRNLYLVGLIGFLVGLIGVYRIGEAVSFDTLFLNIASESLWTGYSMLTCIDQMDKVKLFEWPDNFLTSSIGIFPSAIIGDKQERVISLQDMGYDISSPLGACSVFASALCNFGILGSALFFLFFGYFYGYLWAKRATLFSYLGASPRLGGVVASVSLCIVPFTFFRDPFTVSFYQMLIKNAFLIPVGICVVHWVINATVKADERMREA